MHFPKRMETSRNTRKESEIKRERNRAGVRKPLSS